MSGVFFNGLLSYPFGRSANPAGVLNERSTTSDSPIEHAGPKTSDSGGTAQVSMYPTIKPSMPNPQNAKVSGFGCSVTTIGVT